jgi:3-oxoadipate enol-lactonase
VPIAHVNGIDINYQLEGEGPETLVLINGLADDLESWGFQMPDLLAAGLRVLRFDNRGVGNTDSPSGPYTSRLLADDAKALVEHLGISDFHLMGVSMGGMISQEYALAYGSDLRSLTLACTYAAPGPFCSRMFALWGDMAPKLGVPFVMRDVTLWAFTVPFFSQRPDEAAEFEDAMAAMEMSVDSYLSQLNVIQTHDATDRLASLEVPTLVLAGEEDILIPVRLSQSLHQLVPGSAWVTVPGGHASLWEHPTPFNTALIDFIRSQSH